MSDKYNSSYKGTQIDAAIGHALNLGGSGNAAPQSSITPVETSPSTHGYTVGKLLTYNGQLYRVIASISIGDTLTVNTNIAATTIADEIDGIVTDISTSTPTDINGVLAGDGTHVVSKQIVESRTITKQDYDNLSAADKAKDILYHITDDDPSQLTFDNVPTAGSNNPVKSGGIKSALDVKADKNALATIHQTSPTCTETNGIAAGVFFYLDNELVVAKTAIANGATFTLNTNYEPPTAGSLNDLMSAIVASKEMNLELIKTSITADGSTTFDRSKYRAIWIQFWNGNSYRQSSIYPINYIGGASGCGLDFVWVNSTRNYLILQTYNDTTHTLSYICSIGTTGGNFILYGELK